MHSTTTNELITFLRGRLDIADLPQKLELDTSLWRAMDELWQRSVQHIAQGRVSEWGGVLVLDEKDNLKLVNVVKGTEKYLPLRRPTQHTFVGSFHTHPYSDGTTGIAFSGGDIADTINSGELISIVQSGKEVFVLFRTEATAPFADRYRLKFQYKALHDNYLAQGRSEQDAVHYTNMDLCEMYSLAFYSGQVFHPLEEVYKP